MMALASLTALCATSLCTCVADALFKLCGSVDLSDSADIDARIANKVSANPKERILSNMRFSECQLVPGDAAGHVVGLQGLFRSVICAAGGTRWTGRKPRGGLAWKNKRGEL
jgi:hypothetical protein